MVRDSIKNKFANILLQFNHSKVRREWLHILEFNLVKALNLKRGLAERHGAKKLPKKKKEDQMDFYIFLLKVNKFKRESDHMLSFIVKISIRSINWSSVIPFRIDEYFVHV